MTAIKILTAAVAMLTIAALDSASAQQEGAPESPATGQGMMGESGSMMGDHGSMMGDRGSMMGGGGMMQGMGGGALAMCGRMTAHIEGRLAFLKAELKITPEQESLWDTYAAAIRDNAKTISKGCTAMMEQSKDKRPPLPERLDTYAQFMQSRIEALRAVSQALKPLYAALSDTQKDVADQMIRGSTGFM